MRFQPDSITDWRIDQVAKMENRTYQNAAAALIKEAWDLRLESAIAKAMPGMPKPEPVPHDSPSATVTAHMHGALIASVKKIAADERRSISAVVNILIREGLRSRGILPAISTVAAPAA